MEINVVLNCEYGSTKDSILEPRSFGSIAQVSHLQKGRTLTTEIENGTESCCQVSARVISYPESTGFLVSGLAP